MRDARPCMLLVEDEAGIAKVMQALMKLQKVDCVWVENREQAAAALEGRKFDGVIVDHNFPNVAGGKKGGHGLGLIQESREGQGLNRDTPMLFCTSHFELFDEAKALGNVECVAKPTPPGYARTFIDKVTSNSQAVSASGFDR